MSGDGKLTCTQVHHYADSVRLHFGSFSEFHVKLTKSNNWKVFKMKSTCQHDSAKEYI